jgi:D-lactate dehydrogenase
LFSAKRYETPRFEEANDKAGGRFLISPLAAPLNLDTVEIAGNADVVCVFVNDVVDRPVLEVRKTASDPYHDR